MRNFYKVLGIASTADDGRIKSAFRRRAKKVHPDVNPGNRRAEARFVELVEAYEVLRHAETRASYDAYLAERRHETRRRLVHCAGLATGSFAMTTMSALFAMSLAGADVPLRESWQLALQALSPAMAEGPRITGPAIVPAGDPPQMAAWMTRVKPAPEAPIMKRARVALNEPSASEVGGNRPAVAGARVASAPSAAHRQARMGVRRVTSKAPVAGAHRMQSPAWQPPAEPQENWWPWGPGDDEQPYYGLGAKGL
ncbi:MAG TPA: DnaJ domain-containing protein [Hyphomicrobiaceae bacterium]|nr:DnaJ domain-containing protein [Hyphomicrobiaceae bacterium]